MIAPSEPSLRAQLAPRALLGALAAPRRAVPMAALGALFVAIELWSQPSLAVAGYTLLLFTAFALLAPLSWCRLGHSTAGRVLHCLLAVLCTLLFGVGLRHVLGVPTTLLTDPVGLVAIAGGFAVGGYSIGRDVQLEWALSRAERHAEHAQLLALRAHLDPHFLFNTLNAIAEWCREDAAVAERATLKLAGMLRAILEAIKHPRWPLARELELVEDLFALYQVRDPERFVLRQTIDPALGNEPVPPLLLLSLAENAIKHGPAAGQLGPVELEVARGACDELMLRVSNAGEFMGPRAGGEGLAMVEQRLFEAYRGAAQFTIGSRARCTTAELSLPLEGRAQRSVPHG